MCPYLNPSTNECRVTPSDSDAYQDSERKNNICMDSSFHKSCGNYEAVQRGDYKIVR